MIRVSKSIHFLTIEHSPARCTYEVETVEAVAQGLARIAMDHGRPHIANDTLFAGAFFQWDTATTLICVWVHGATVRQLREAFRAGEAANANHAKADVRHQSVSTGYAPM